MNSKLPTLVFLCALLGGCLYSGEGTLGLPCNTDTECGGTQQCIESICGGPTAVATDVSVGGPDTDASSSGDAPMETNADSDDNDDDVRTECEASETECLDGDTLRMCTEDGKLSTRDCEGWCGQGAAFNGCQTDPNGQDACYCLNSAQPCTDEGAFHCDGDNYTHCEDGFAIPTDCDAQCVKDGYTAGVDHCGLADNGDVTCFCYGGSACEDGASRCVDDETVAECSGGSWSTYDCSETNCPEGTYSRGCTYFAGDTSACGCWDL